MNDEAARGRSAPDASEPVENHPRPKERPADPSAEIRARSEALENEVAELKDRVLRTLAEMENLRRRTDREVADARTYGVTSFARDLLAVSDNMRRALETVGADARENADASIKALIDGIELTERELHKVMEKHGIARIEPHGQRFDPNFHQAMFELPDPSAPSGTVVQVVQAGYTIGDRVLRPALVGVAKGGPKAEAPPANANPQGASAPSGNEGLN